MKRTAKSVIGELDTNVNAINDINKEIKEQNEKLLEMEDVIKESQSYLKRARELISYFDKAFAKDLTLKIILFVIIVVVLGIIVFIVVYKTTANKEQPVQEAKNLIQGTGRVSCEEAKPDYFLAAVTNRPGLKCLEYVNQLSGKSSSDLIESPESEFPKEVTNPPAAEQAASTETKRVLRLNMKRRQYKKENTPKFAPISDETRKLINTDHYFRTLKRNLELINSSNKLDQNL